MSLPDLALRLISIPSYVDAVRDESEALAFLTQWAQENLPVMKLRTLPVRENRYNILITPRSGPLEILFTAHVDTVLPSGGWTKPVRSSTRITGLGAVDMKGAMAAMLFALAAAGERSRAGILLYVDEEYDFAGMLSLVARRRTLPRPTMIVTGEPTDGRINNGCRGIGTLDLTIAGVTAHSARPEGGRSVADGFIVLRKVMEELARESADPLLGPTLLNFYETQWGLQQEGSTSITGSDNRIPDIARVRVGLRLTNPKLRLRDWKAPIASALRTAGYRLLRYDIGHEYRAMATAPEKLGWFEEAVRAMRPDGSPLYCDIRSSGYDDVQMLAAALKVPAVSIGLGPMALAHRAGEYLLLRDLQRLAELYTTIALRGARCIS